MKKSLLLLFIVFVSLSTFSQEFEIGTELRPKFEYRHGYKSIIPEDATPGAAISQRSRLNLSYKNSLLSTYFSVQNIRTWGDMPMSNNEDLNGTMLHQAWGEINLTPMVAIKVGRQILRYNDQRLFGYNNSSQQARTHDAFLLKIKPETNFDIHFGVTYNQNKVTDTGNYYTHVNNYRTFQYLWANYDFGNLDVSLLFNNDGRVNPLEVSTKQKIYFNQTVGPFITYKINDFDLSFSTYLQFGKNQFNIDKSAWYVNAEGHYNATKDFKIGLGIQVLSGENNEDSKDNAFDKLYGASHTFNGKMDYFFAGNSHGNVGLIDMFLPMQYKVNNKLTLLLNPHYFWAQTDVYSYITHDLLDRGLGLEADFEMKYKFTDFVAFEFGYSQFLTSPTLDYLKGVERKTVQNYIWTSVVINPTLFTYKK